MAETRKYPNVLDRSTLVPLGAAIAVVVGMFFGWSSIESRLDAGWDAMDVRLKAIEILQHDQQRDIRELRREVTTDQWTKTNHKLWVAEFRRLNPQLPVPKVEDTQ